MPMPKIFVSTRTFQFSQPFVAQYLWKVTHNTITSHNIWCRWTNHDANFNEYSKHHKNLQGAIQGIQANASNAPIPSNSSSSKYKSKNYARHELTIYDGVVNIAICHYTSTNSVRHYDLLFKQFIDILIPNRTLGILFLSFISMDQF